MPSSLPGICTRKRDYISASQGPNECGRQTAPRTPTPQRAPRQENLMQMVLHPLNAESVLVTGMSNWTVSAVPVPFTDIMIDTKRTMTSLIFWFSHHYLNAGKFISFKYGKILRNYFFKGETGRIICLQATKAHEPNKWKIKNISK